MIVRALFALVLILCLSWAALAQAPERRVALVIANADYIDPSVNDLPNTQRDGTKLVDTLRKAKFTIFGDKTQSNLTKAEMDKTLLAFGKQATQADWAVVYFAGHGVTIGGENFLVPTDAKLESEDDAGLAAVRLNEVMKIVRKAKKIKLVILDACRDNPFKTTPASNVTRSIGASRGLTAVRNSGDTLIMFAANEDEKAAEGDPGGNSPFAIALSEYILTPGLEVRLMAGEVRDRVKELNALAKRSISQEPTIYGTLGKGRFFFVPPMDVPVNSAFDPRQVEVSFWDSIKSSKNRLDFEAYLRQYPHGSYTVLARNRLSELNSSGLKAGSRNPVQKAGNETSIVSDQSMNKSPGESFRDCLQCPEMVVIPAGELRLKINQTSVARTAGSATIKIQKNFAVSKFEVRFSDWDTCVASGACEYMPDDGGWGRNIRPVINVSWSDAQSYVRWISDVTKRKYRLLSEAEWEYAARSSSTTLFPWGNSVGNGNANCSECGSKWDRMSTAPVGSFASNPFGLYDVSGNVAEWVEDCWSQNIYGMPLDGAPSKTGECGLRVLRGGSWFHLASAIRTNSRDRANPGVREPYIGFRVAREL